jgi:transcriptional regulator with XRE-family HTH domain
MRWQGAVPLKNVELLRLGRRIRQERQLLGFSQEDLATKCELDRSYLGGLERGERDVTFSVLCRICDGLTCDIAAVTKGIPHRYTKNEYLN